MIQTMGTQTNRADDGHTKITSLDNFVDDSPATFLWKGHNYLLKMSNDLDFLDDQTISSPVTGWLGFHARGNPFLVPPGDHDICKALQREHAERLKEISARRQQHHHKHPHRHQHRRQGSSNKQRLDNSRVDVNVLRVRGIQEEEPQSMASKLTASASASELSFGVSEIPRTLQSNQQARSVVTHSGDEITQVIIGLRPASTDCAMRGISKVDENELDAFSLSSGEEEEVRWDGGGALDAPIIFPLPKTIIQRAQDAIEVICKEKLGSKSLESKAQRIAAGMRRTARILREPCRELSSRMELLCSRNDPKRLKQYLKARHVNASRLVSASVAGFNGAQQRTLRRVSTAPAPGSCWQEPEFPWRLSSNLEQSSGFGQGGVLGWNDGPTDNYCSSVTVGYPTGQKLRPSLSDTAIETYAQDHDLGQSVNHGREEQSILAIESPDSLVDLAATSLGASASDWFTTSSSSSLHASASNMSLRAHARAMASCRVATRHPCRRGRGKLLLPDPSACAQVRENAACLVQAALLGVRARSLVRRLREQQTRAATTISRVYRGWRMRIVLKLADLKKRMRIQKRNRAALSIAILFRDIVYKRRRVSA